ncbi:two-component system LytT family response regulator [Flavobacterium sp. W4I14]|nr:two-component system LytT family response regulator [Flavobacterium sp. W4I14]
MYCLISIPITTVLLPFLCLAVGIEIYIVKLCIAYLNLPMYYSCAIVDDEQHAIDVLHDYIDGIRFLKLFSAFNNPFDALKTISAGDKIDFLFLDIDMDGMKGTELSRHLRSKARFVIYASAHLENEVRKIDSNFECYLGKPISMKRFAGTIDKLIRLNNLPIKNEIAYDRT